MEKIVDTHEEIESEVIQGLTSPQKYIPSKYFYDRTGSLLFQQIMGLPEYYLSRAEAEIFQNHGENLVSLFGNAFDIVELGAGDGSKTGILIEWMLKANKDFNYIPVDIANDAVDQLTSQFMEQFPGLKVDGLTGDYFKMLDKLNALGNKRKVLFFLGSNLGNFSMKNSLDFLQNINAKLVKGDLLLLGLDLKKHPDIILKAYDDREGVTKNFNLNLLDRMNREFGADFKRQYFIHYPFYNSVNGTVCSSLVSDRQQTVNFKLWGNSIHFQAWEAIHTEISQKYDKHAIQYLADKSGFRILQDFHDSNQYFVNTLWIKK
jgi:L-histidine Nalpha-methyltransferase